MYSRRLNLSEIESTLRFVQRDFDRINAVLNAERTALSDEVLGNLMAGYASVDAALANEVDLFAPGQSKVLLELNNTVLYGTRRKFRKPYSRSIKANEEHFYKDQNRGIGDLIEVYDASQGESVWKRSALVYIHLLGQPQLFLEGNHRSGALLMSYLLAREGKPPFVLSVDNAAAYFNPSSLIGRSKKHSFSMLFRRRKLKKQFARLLKEQANPKFLL